MPSITTKVTSIPTLYRISNEIYNEISNYNIESNIE